MAETKLTAAQLRVLEQIADGNPRFLTAWVLGTSTSESLRKRGFVEGNHRFTGRYGNDPVLHITELGSDVDHVRKIVAAYLAALSSVQTVKPLEWEESDERWWGAMPIHGLRYEVCVTDRGSVRVRWPESGGWEDFDGDLDVAKAAAQANFEARIRSCLLPTPQPVEGPREPAASSLLVNDLMDALFGPFDPRSNSQAWVSPDRAEVRARLEKALSLATPPLPAQGTDEPLTPMSGFLTFIKDMRFTGSWDLPTLDRVIEVGETITAQNPSPAQGTVEPVAWTMRTLFRAMQEACANYIEPTTYIARFPAESTLRATEFAEPHPLNSDVQKRVMKERRDTAFINDIIRMLDGPEQREAEAFASPPVDSDALEALREFAAWVDTWVSNPVTAYSVSALDGLFAMTRDKLAALSHGGTDGQ